MSAARKMTQFRLPEKTRKQIAELKRTIAPKATATDVVIHAVQILADSNLDNPAVLTLHVGGTVSEGLARDVTIDAGAQSVRLIRNGDPVLKPGHKTL